MILSFFGGMSILGSVPLLLDKFVLTVSDL